MKLRKKWRQRRRKKTKNFERKSNKRDNLKKKKKNGSGKRGKNFDPKTRTGFYINSFRMEAIQCNKLNEKKNCFCK